MKRRLEGRCSMGGREAAICCVDSGVSGCESLGSMQHRFLLGLLEALLFVDCPALRADAGALPVDFFTLPVGLAAVPSLGSGSFDLNLQRKRWFIDKREVQ